MESLARQWHHPAHEIAVDHEGHNSVTHREEANADILDVYAKDIAGIVERELNNEDPTGLQPLFLFATDPLEDLPQDRRWPRTIVRVPGGSDDLTVDGVDGAIRAGLEEINAQRAGETVDTLADGISRAWSPPTSSILRGPPSAVPSTPWSTTSPSTSWAASTVRPVRWSTSTTGTTCCRGSRSQCSPMGSGDSLFGLRISTPTSGTVRPSHGCASRCRSRPG